MSMPNQVKPKGIFDKSPEDNISTNTVDNKQPEAPRKEVFKDPFSEQAASVAERSKRQVPDLESLVGDSTLERTADAVNNAGSGKNVQADLDEMDKFSEEDLELAEQMIFRGYAEFDAVMPKLPKYKFTICSTSAEEIAIVDEIVFDLLKKSENSDGTVNLPQNNVQGLRNSLFLAISYRGMNKEELSPDSSCHLNTIKKAIIRVSEMENNGDLENSVKLKDSLKNKLLKRATIIKRLATPMIDFLADKKYEFDSKMLGIISSQGLLPKS